MWHVHQVTAQATGHFLALHIPAHRVRSEHRNGPEIFGKVANLSDLFRWTKQEILVLAIKPGQRTDDVAGVCAHAELVHPANVDGNLHKEIVPARCPRRTRKTCRYDEVVRPSGTTSKLSFIHTSGRLASMPRCSATLRIGFSLFPRRVSPSFTIHTI